MTDNVVPFLKWAGGKRWLLQHKHLLPNSITGKYIEPFLGSGALFFLLCPERALLSDINYRLIETYTAIKLDWQLVLKYLKKHQVNHSDEYYYSIRKKKYRSVFSRAAQLIYLNRTCWNGLYRVNLKGEFNVPRGTKNNVLLSSDNFMTISKRLNSSALISCDFEKAVDQAQDGDFIFADPPYTVQHSNNGFRKYNETLFSWDDQIRLRNSLFKAAERGSTILLTNASSKCIYDLYADRFTITKVKRNSLLAGDVSYRSIAEEFIIRSCYNDF